MKNFSPENKFIPNTNRNKNYAKLENLDGKPKVLKRNRMTKFSIRFGCCRRVVWCVGCFVFSFWFCCFVLFWCGFRCVVFRVVGFLFGASLRFKRKINMRHVFFSCRIFCFGLCFKTLVGCGFLMLVCSTNIVFCFRHNLGTRHTIHNFVCRMCFR